METKLPAWKLVDHEPARDKDDKALFDRSTDSKRTARLLDRHPAADIEERRNESRNPYTLKRRARRPRLFKNRGTGEIRERLRGGKNWEPIHEPWSPEGLLRVRGRLLRTPPKVIEIEALREMVCRPLLCSGQYGDLIVSLNYVEGLFIKNSRRKAWVDYPQGWAAIDPDHGPHVLKKAAEAAIAGGDVSGHNVPGGAEFAARARDANERAGRTVGSSGPYLDEGRSDPLNRQTDPNCGAGEYSAAGAGKRWFGEHRQKRAGAIARFRYGLGNEFYARGLYRLELEERKQLSRERLWAPGQPMPVDRTRRKTSEDRNAIGEYGAETMMSPDGRVLFGKVLPVLNHASVKVRGIRSYTQKAEIGGKTIERQKAAGPVTCIVGEPPRRGRRNKTGPKPSHGFRMTDRLRKIKQRCAGKGVPFVWTLHVSFTGGSVTVIDKRESPHEHANNKR